MIRKIIHIDEEKCNGCGLCAKACQEGAIGMVNGTAKLLRDDYTEKLTEIIRRNDIRSLTIVRMEVPCCGGLERAAVAALQASGKFIPWQVVVISTDGKILDR